MLPVNRRRRSGIVSESGVGCLSILDQGEQREVRSRASVRLRELTNEPSTLFGTAQSKSTIRPRAIPSAPDNDEQSYEIQVEKKDISVKANVPKARAVSFSHDHSKSPIENTVTPRSLLSTEVTRKPHEPLEDVRKELEKALLSSLKQGFRASTSPFEGQASSSGSAQSQRTVSAEHKRPFASTSIEEYERPFASISEEFVRVAEDLSSTHNPSYPQDEEVKPEDACSPSLNKGIMLHEQCNEIVQSKTLDVNVKKQELLEPSTPDSDESRRNAKSRNRIIDKIKNLPRSRLFKGVKQPDTSTKTTGKAVRPWY